MRTAKEIYEVYRIPPLLQLHQLRVAAVAKWVCKHLDRPIDTAGVVLAGLFHDMGNILKFDFVPGSPTTNALAEGIEYWKTVQADFRKRYGDDEHGATIAIMQEMGLPEHVIGYADTVGFGKVAELLVDPSYEKKIVEYGDLRTGPFGVLSVIERQEDGYQRYKERYRAQGKNPEEYFGRLRENALKLEAQLFEHVSLQPERITDEAIAPLIDELREYPVTVS